MFMTAMGTAVRSVLHALPKVLHLFLVEGVELFKLFGGQDSGKGLHPVDAVFQQGLVYIEYACLGGIDSGRILAFKSFA